MPPAFGRRGHDVEVRHEEEGTATRAVTAESCHDGAAPRLGLDHLGGDALGLQEFGEMAGGRDLVARDAGDAEEGAQLVDELRAGVLGPRRGDEVSDHVSSSTAPHDDATEQVRRMSGRRSRRWPRY